MSRRTEREAKRKARKAKIDDIRAAIAHFAAWQTIQEKEPALRWTVYVAKRPHGGRHMVEVGRDRVLPLGVP